jgi:hypothetical protein
MMRVVCDEGVDDTLLLADDVSAFAVFVVVDQQWESSIKSIRQKQKAERCSLK